MTAVVRAMIGRMNFIIDRFYTFHTDAGNDGYVNLVKILIYKGDTS